MYVPNPAAAQALATFPRRLLDEMLYLAEQETRARVEPGVGPGPHPHLSRHEDTGQLRDSIRSNAEGGKHGPVGVISAGTHYAPFLELGYEVHNEVTGWRVVQYPFLFTAGMEAVAVMRRGRLRQMVAEMAEAAAT